MADDIRIGVETDGTDKAGRELDELADKVDALDGRTTEVTVDADDRASADLEGVDAAADALDGRTTDVTVDADDHASGDLDRVRSEVAALDGATAEVTVDADTGGARRGLADLAGSLGDIQGGLDGLQGGLEGVAGALGPTGAAVGGAVAALAGMADAAAGAATEMATLSQITGESIEDTSRLARVWQNTGADVGDLADVIAQVNGVLAQQPELVRQLGIELEGASPQDVFIQAVEAANSLSDSQERLRVGAQLFGEEGVRQVAGLQARYGDLSDAIDAVDSPFTDADVAQALQYEQAMADLKAELGALATEVGQSLLPNLITLVETLNEGAGPLADLAGKSAEGASAFGVMKGGLTSVIDGISALRGETDDAADSTSFMTDVMGPLTSEMGRQADEAGRDADEIDRQRQALEAAREAQINAADTGLALSDAQTALSDATAATTEAAQAQADAIRDHGAASDEARTATDALTGAQRTERDAAINAAKAAADHAASQKESAGQSLSANGRISALNRSLIDSARNATPAARDEIIKYIAQLNGITEEEATRIVVSTSGVGEADRQINEAARDREATISVRYQRPTRNLEEAFGFRSTGPTSSGMRAPVTPAAAGGLLRADGVDAEALAAFPIMEVAPQVTVHVDARGAIDPYSVGRAVTDAAEAWGRVAGRWRPGVPGRVLS